MSSEAGAAGAARPWCRRCYRIGFADGALAMAIAVTAAYWVLNLGFGWFQ